MIKNRILTSVFCLSAVSSFAVYANETTTAVNSWWWTGNGDFLTDTNWYQSGLAGTGNPSSNTGLNVDFGPLEDVSNSGTFITPTGSAILSADFTSTGILRMRTGIDTELSINNNAIYSLSSAQIGLLPTNNWLTPTDGTATVNLDNGHISGPVVVGVNSTGVLNSTAVSSVTGNLTLAQQAASHGTLNISTASDFQ